jgi:chorismate lyase / 3-hydroxybenzoate synthase
MRPLTGESVRYVPEGSPLADRNNATIRPGQPWLGGSAGENLVFFEGRRGRSGIFEWVRSPDYLLGWTAVSGRPNLEEAARELYRRMLALADGLELYHIWNWVPAINQRSTGGEENYRLFCLGRAEGFEEACGRGFERRLPSASAVGHRGDLLMLGFVAGRHPVRHLENPEQVPAWRYPSRYGPRSPSFARASVVETPGGSIVWVSGTASIKGSETVCPGDFSGQLATTVSNLEGILEQAGAELRCGAVGESRFFRVYLRDRKNFGKAEDFLRRTVLGADDSVVWVEAAICREDLEVEIELTIYPPEFPAPAVLR